VPGQSVHLMKRGHNREKVFDEDLDCEVFLHIVRTAADRHELHVHGFALMVNHFHLHVTPQHPQAASNSMKDISSNYGRHYARNHERMGSIWNGRPKMVAIESAWQWLVCLRYIDRNAVDAGIVDKPEAYRWTSYNAHTGTTKAYAWLIEHEHFRRLGPTAAEAHDLYHAYG